MIIWVGIEGIRKGILVTAEVMMGCNNLKVISRDLVHGFRKRSGRLSEMR